MVFVDIVNSKGSSANLDNIENALQTRFQFQVPAPLPAPTAITVPLPLFWNVNCGRSEGFLFGFFAAYTVSSILFQGPSNLPIISVGIGSRDD